MIIDTDPQALEKHQRAVLKCAEEHHRYYIFEMPDELSDDETASLFLEFVATILGRTKLLESKFVLIADDTYTTKYFEILASGGRYRHGLLNMIDQAYISRPVDICKIQK